MQVTVIFFPLFRKISGTDRLEMEVPEGSHISTLMEMLSERYQHPVFKEQPVTALINHKVTLPETALQEGDEVLLLPVMDGG